MTCRRAALRRFVVASAMATLFMGCGIDGGTPPVDGYPIIDAPDYPLFDHTLTWTGDDVIVIGGAGGDTTDGLLVDEPLAWNPTDGVRPIPSPPGETRNRHTTVWTGEELFVWSGTTEPFGVGDGLISSSAAYNPATQTWRELAASPADVARVRGRGTYFNGSVIVTGGSTPDAGNEGTIGLHDLVSDTWEVISVDGDALTVVASDNAAYVLWADEERAIRFSHLDATTGRLVEIPLPDLPEGADRSNVVVAGGRLVVWAEASPSEPGRSDGVVTVLVLDDDSALAASPTASAGWRKLAVEVEFPGSATGFSEVRPLVHTDNWLAFMEGAELKWIRIDDGLEVRRSLTTPQSCALNTEAVGTPEYVVAWGGNCSLVNDDGSEEQLVEHFVFEPPADDLDETGETAD